MDSFFSLFDPSEESGKHQKTKHKDPDNVKKKDTPKGRRRGRRSQTKNETLPEECSFLCDPESSADVVKDESYIENYMEMPVRVDDKPEDKKPKRRNSARKSRRRKSKASPCKEMDETYKLDACYSEVDVLNNVTTNVKCQMQSVGKNVNDLRVDGEDYVKNSKRKCDKDVNNLIAGLSSASLSCVLSQDLESGPLSAEDSASEDSEDEGAPLLPPEPRFGNVEYKLHLVEPSERRFQHLITQLKWRLCCGGGTAVYVVGVRDCGKALGLSARKLLLSLRCMSDMARVLGASLLHVNARPVPHRSSRALLEIHLRKLPDRQQSVELRVAVMGAHEAGKSTLIGVLTQGELDNGRGSARLNMFRHVHEVRSGNTSSLSHEILGFDSEGNVVNYGSSELMTAERIGERSAKLLAFLDLAGHTKYQKTTVSALTGYWPHCAMLVVSATAGITTITEEHIELLLALEIPFFVVICKSELQPSGIATVLTQLERCLQGKDKKLVLIKDEAAARNAFAPKTLILDSLNENKEDKQSTTENVCVFPVSCVKGTGLNALHAYLLVLEPTIPEEQTDKQDGTFEFQIDEIFHVATSFVVCGVLAEGTLAEGDEALIGPLESGEFIETKVVSIYRNRVPCDIVRAGQTASLGLTQYPKGLRQGMVLLSLPQGYREKHKTEVSPENTCTCENDKLNGNKSKKQQKFDRANSKNVLNAVKECLCKDMDAGVNEYASVQRQDKSVQRHEGSVQRHDGGVQKHENVTASLPMEVVWADDPNNPRGCLYFQASLHLLRHSGDGICEGFQWTVHVGNVRQTAIVEALLTSSGALAVGSQGSCVMRFVRREFVRRGRRLLGRCGGTTARGCVTQVFAD